MDSVMAATTVSAPFEQSLAPYYPALVRRLTLIVGDPEDARDLAQTAYLRAVESWARFAGVDARAWPYTIGIRLALNELRRRRRMWVRHPAEPDASWALEVDPDLWRCLETLEPRRRSALLLSALDGHTHAEIGQMLGVPAGTVSSWLSRSKAQSRELLKETPDA
jgi:RNA polymerase sigma factor (sigma-70 family)